MSFALKMADGDIFINDRGRSETVEGPDKVSQELADLYLTLYNQAREWGSEFDVGSFGSIMSPAHARSILFLRVNQANDRLIARQRRMTTLSDSERVTSFSRVDVKYDKDTQTAYFLTQADFQSGTITKTMQVDFRPVSLNHIVPPPTTFVGR